MKALPRTRFALLFAMTLLAGCYTASVRPTPPAPPRAEPRPVDDLAVVFVIQGLEVWMGNDTYTPPGGERYEGHYHSVRAAIDAAAVELPSRASMGLITYATGMSLRAALRRPQPAASTSLGPQDAYYGNAFSDLVLGLEGAVRLLRSSAATRKLVVVIGDGNDTMLAAAEPALIALKARAASLGIETTAMILRCVVSSDPPPTIRRFADQLVDVDDEETLIAAVRALVTRAAADARSTTRAAAR